MKKIEFIWREAIHLLPTITSQGFCFLFWIFWYNKERTDAFRIGYVTPCLTFSWQYRRFQWNGTFWNWGFRLNLYKTESDVPFFQRTVVEFQPS